MSGVFPSVNDLGLKILFLLIPGIIAFFIIKSIGPKRPRTDFESGLQIFLYGVVCYAIAGAIEGGYPVQVQQKLASVLSWQFSDASAHSYTIITNENLPVLRQYHYECAASPGGFGFGERRFIGVYWSQPSHYLTVVGLRLIGGELRVYRIAREFPYHNAGELASLAQQLYPVYGGRILFYRYLSSNVPFSVQKDGADGWFGRSTMFNPENPSALDAELVLIDPSTRQLLQPTSMPDTGEISYVPNPVPNVCARQMPVQ